MNLKNQIFKNYSKSTSSINGVFILSAVRTPIGLTNGTLKDFTAPQLGAFAITEALQRAVVPPQDFENIFLSCVSHKNCHEEVLRRTGLSQKTKLTTSLCGMRSFLKAAEFLQMNDNKVIVAGGMESFTNSSYADSQLFETKTKLEKSRKNITNHLKKLDKCMEENYQNFLTACKNGAFTKEVLKINFRKKGRHITITEDEVSRKPEGGLFLESSLMPGDQAVALVISTKNYFENNDLIPLAEIISFIELPSDTGDLTSAVEKALKLAKCQQEDIKRWETFSVNDLVDFVSSFNVDSSQVNANGGVFGFGDPIGSSGLMSVCHLTHSLSSGELGCVMGCDQDGIASAVIVKKLESHKLTKPQLTLYTKHQCPLCDELKQQLKSFEGQFSLTEVDIENKGNEKYKELFQYEIPVLFLNGIFLCKHRLNVQDFKYTLENY